LTRGHIGSKQIFDDMQLGFPSIHELDQCSLRGPQTGQDRLDWDEARKLLIGILDRNGFELAAPSKRIRKARRSKP
jgi:hypothetical protein